jgi:saccharopine dehydrogenase (NAD+, L-lysine-forming)
MRVLMIGAGGVGGVVAHKLCQVPEVFTDILLASRTKSRVDALAAELSREVETAQVDADDVPALTRLIQEFKPDLVMNIALPYQDLHIMDACLAAGVDIWIQPIMNLWIRRSLSISGSGRIMNVLKKLV